MSDRTPAIEAVSILDDGIVVKLSTGIDTRLGWRWLRDHGEDPISFNQATQQRQIYALDPVATTPASSVGVVRHQDRTVVQLHWPDLDAPTYISEPTLVELIAPTRASKQTTWSDPSAVDLTIGHVDQVLVDDGALAAWLDDLEVYGCARLEGFTGGHDQVDELARRIGYPRSSIFGSLWDLSASIDSHDDTAYSQSFLAPHTDGTYSHDAPGLQMFCCIERDGTGGESVIVDGLALAEDLRACAPEDFATLTSVPVPAHYIEPDVELRASRPALKLDAHGRVEQISMNNYDRSPMLLAPEDMEAFYRAYGRLHSLANDQSRWLSIGLSAGDVLINDNWRVLHGRQAYTGARSFVGCYLNHEDFESRLRTLR